MELDTMKLTDKKQDIHNFRGFQVKYVSEICLTG